MNKIDSDATLSEILEALEPCAEFRYDEGDDSMPKLLDDLAGLHEMCVAEEVQADDSPVFILRSLGIAIRKTFDSEDDTWCVEWASLDVDGKLDDHEEWSIFSGGPGTPESVYSCEPIASWFMRELRDHGAQGANPIEGEQLTDEALAAAQGIDRALTAVLAQVFDLPLPARQLALRLALKALPA